MELYVFKYLQKLSPGINSDAIALYIIPQEEETQISGIVMVGDFSGLGLTQVKHFERSYAKILTSIIQVRL